MAKRFSVTYSHDCRGYQVDEDLPVGDLFNSEDYDTYEPISNRKGKPYTFENERHAQCFAAALNLGWEALQKQGDAQLKSK